MINVSEQLKEESKKNHNYYVTANVTLADGTKLSLEKKDFYLDGKRYADVSGGRRRKAYAGGGSI